MREPVLPLPIGRLLPLSPEGHLASDASADHIPLELKPILGLVVGLYEDVLGDDLHSVYLRGSVVRGSFRPGYSDLDTWAVRRSGVPNFEVLEGLEEALTAQFPTVTGVELAHIGLDGLPLPPEPMRMLLSTHSICIEGEDLLPTLGTFRPTRAICSVLDGLPGGHRSRAPGVIPHPAPEEVWEMTRATVRAPPPHRRPPHRQWGHGPSASLRPRSIGPGRAQPPSRASSSGSRRSR